MAERYVFKVIASFVRAAQVVGGEGGVAGSQ